MRAFVARFSSSIWFMLGILLLIATHSLPVRSEEKSPTKPAADKSSTTRHLAVSMGRLPLGFEALPGLGTQRFAARGTGYLLALSPQGMSLQVKDNAAPQGNAAADPDAEAFNANQLNGNWDPLARISAPLGSGTHAEYRATTVQMRLGEANQIARAEVLEQQTARVNYFIGNDPAAWRTNVPVYGKVRYHEVYPGVDVAYYGNPQQLELDFEVRPQGDPGSVRLEFPAEARAELTTDGELQIKPAGRDAAIRLHAPVTYQMIDGQRILIGSRYQKLGENSYGFVVSDYDHSQTLVIDPVIAYSTYLGGNGYDDIQSIAVDAAGNIYVAGYTESANFPTATPISGTRNAASGDTFVSKLNSSGTTLLYSTYLGGSGFDEIFGIAVSATGEVTIAGDTSSTDFPLKTPIQPAYGGGGADLFVARINASGSALSYSTYLGGSGTDVGLSLEGALPMLHVDAAGAAYIAAATTSTNFPTVAALQPVLAGQLDGLIVKINPSGSSLDFSTYFGGSSVDYVSDITTDTAGNIYVVGTSNSTNLPIQSALDGTLGGGTCGTTVCPDAFVAKLNSAGSSLLYSTYLGGSADEEGRAIGVDGTGSAYVTGYTSSTDFPTATPLQASKGAGQDAFISKLNPSGSALVYSTYLGAGGGETGFDIKVDASGRAIITGYTGSNAFPTASPTQAARAGGLDAFLTILNAAGSAFDFSTYVGGTSTDVGLGVALGPNGDVYVAGWTESANFPVAGGLQTTFGGGTCGTAPNTFPCDDGFITRIGSIGVAPSITSLSPNSATAGGAAFTLTVNGSGFNANSLVRVGVLSRPTTFVSGTQLTAAMPASDLTNPGTLQISVFNGAPDNLASNTLPFTVNAAANAPLVSQGGVVNNASFTPSPAPIAPGSIAAIFGQRLNEGSTVLSSSFDNNGRLVTSLGGARVTLNGIAAPLFYSTPGQLGIQVPVELAGQSSASLQVTVGTQQSSPVTVTLAASAPGIFTASQDGRGPGAITHADGTPVDASHPARPGEIVIIYVTGLGALVPSVGTGLRAGASPTLTPAVVTFNGIAGAVDYSGSAPGFVGLNQINVRVPEGTLPSNTVQVVVRIGGLDSNTATIAVQ